MRPLSFIFAFTFLLFASQTRGQGVNLSSLNTRAEASQYTETTRYEEVMAFLTTVTKASKQMHLTSFGYTTEGRSLPLVVVGRVKDASPEAVFASKKTRVFLQANIHAGEVEGKEALLMLLRALATGQHAQWADSLVLLIAPIYNADGNERVSLYNRPLQYGPVGGMGQRPNAQGFDLNRDHMKLESPEARSLVRLMRQYDPHVLVDLHTTDGTVHAYHLTYSPPLNPNTYAPIISLLRGDWLPSMTKTIKQKYGWEYYYYGNLPGPAGPDVGTPRGWYTFDHRPRFNNNYIGLRNRIAILSEAYSYAIFEERIRATLYFVEEILNYAQTHASRIRQVVEAADAHSIVGESLAVRARFARSSAPVEILLGEVAEEKHPYTGAAMWRRLDVRKPERMDEYGTFEPVETTAAPRTYFVPPALKNAVDRLEAHGIRYETLTAERRLTVEQFRIDSTKVAEQPFQGHRERTLFGAYERVEITLPAGTLVVPVDQPLGRLVVYLLEPRSDDGLVDWALLDDAITGAKYYPILRLPADAETNKGR